MKNLIRSLAIFFISGIIFSFVIQDKGYLLETKNCRILFPQKPINQSQKVNTAVGELSLDMFIYQVPDSIAEDNLFYLLGVSDYPESKISSDKKELLDTFFRHSVDGAVANVNGKILTEIPITLKGYPGREVRVDFQNGLAVITMRLYLVKSRAFILETITATKKDLNKSINKFFDSFAIMT